MTKKKATTTTTTRTYRARTERKFRPGDSPWQPPLGLDFPSIVGTEFWWIIQRGCRASQSMGIYRGYANNTVRTRGSYYSLFQASSRSSHRYRGSHRAIQDKKFSIYAELPRSRRRDIGHIDPIPWNSDNLFNQLSYFSRLDLLCQQASVFVPFLYRCLRSLRSPLVQTSSLEHVLRCY